MCTRGCPISALLWQMWERCWGRRTNPEQAAQLHSQGGGRERIQRVTSIDVGAAVPPPSESGQGGEGQSRASGGAGPDGVPSNPGAPNTPVVGVLGWKPVVGLLGRGELDDCPKRQSAAEQDIDFGHAAGDELRRAQWARRQGCGNASGERRFDLFA